MTRTGFIILALRKRKLALRWLPLISMLACVAYLPSDLANAQVVGVASQDSNARQLQTTKLNRENEKLALEIDKLKSEQSSILNRWGISTPWAAPITALIGVVLSGLVAWMTAIRTRMGTFRLALLNKRLALYPELETATMPFAVFFPNSALCPADCLGAGKKLREVYFDGAGILLSKKARDQYFMLMEALIKAASADKLDVPTTDDYAHRISVASLDQYRKELGLNYVGSLDRWWEGLGLARIGSLDKCWNALGLGHVKNLDEYRKSLSPDSETTIKDWNFGDESAMSRLSVPGLDPNREIVRKVAIRFRDFVLLQTLSSSLRTALADDILGRSGRPA